MLKVEFTENHTKELQLLKDAWKDIKIEGAEIILKHSKVPEMNPEFEWLDGMDYDDLLNEAFTGKLIDRWTVGWKAIFNGKKYGNYLFLGSPIADPSVVEVLRQNFEYSKKEFE
jgi:hypothetical protein